MGDRKGGNLQKKRRTLVLTFRQNFNKKKYFRTLTFEMGDRVKQKSLFPKLNQPQKYIYINANDRQLISKLIDPLAFRNK